MSEIQGKKAKPYCKQLHYSLSGDRGTLEDVAWFVQVSDLHISRFAAEQMPLYGDKVADFRAFTERVLKPLKPKVLILTGDLVDAKSKNMQGRQYEEEWKVGADPTFPPRGGRIIKQE